MRQRDLNLLEYEKFLENLSNYTFNEKTKEKIKSLKPQTNESEVKKRINLVNDFIKIYERERFFPLSEFPDIENHLKLLSIEESILSSSEIKDIATILSISRQIKKFLQNSIRKENEELFQLYRKLFSSRELERIINDSIDEAGFIKDSASRDLSKIRKEIKEVERKIVSILENIIHSYKYEDIIQEKIITTRKERYVIPVKENFSSKLKGIIHDRSSTGHTVFVEPINIVELNNKLSDLKIREQIEIRKILKFLTDTIRISLRAIRQTFEAIIEFDTILAIAKYSVEFSCNFPKFSKKVSLKSAKHPLFLISNKEFKPIDIFIDSKNKGLIITGPNTGGKTVALKTLGIFALLVQSGMPVPVLEDSEIPVFEGIFVDIGDYQSIEANLSTYSWHISNIKEILSKVNENSLVLLDELIPGTDPDEGSAIGIGILKFLKEKGVYTVATSHFRQIKLFALSDDYFEVASVGFDREKLSPTYTLHYKTIGQSMAFYIAEKLGFYKEILEEAKKHLNEENIKLDEALQKLEEYKVFYDEESKKVNQLRKQLEEEKEKYQKLNEELERLKKQKWKESLKEIEEFVKQVKKEGYQVLEEIKTSKSGKAIEQFGKKVKQQVLNHKEETEEALLDYLNIGDKVRIKGKNTVGEIISIRETKANVNFNGLKIWVPLKELEKVEEVKTEKKTKFHISRKKVNIKPEINLIGLTKDEAIRRLDEFLDKAVLEGYNHLRIIHGYGSGVLRKAVREYLETSPYNLEFKDAEYNEGGMGVTIVEFKSN